MRPPDLRLLRLAEAGTPTMRLHVHEINGLLRKVNDVPVDAIDYSLLIEYMTGIDKGLACGQTRLVGNRKQKLARLVAAILSAEVLT